MLCYFTSLTHFSLIVVSFFLVLLTQAALAFLGEGYLSRLVAVNGNSPLTFIKARYSATYDFN